MHGDIPQDGPEFEIMMQEIDAKMREDGVAITARPILAFRHISLKYRVAIPVFDPGPRAPLELRRLAPLSNKVHQWFEATYGDRLKIDPTLGRMVLNLDGDLYAMRLPLFYGTGEFLASKRFFPKMPLNLNQSFRANIIELIEDITPAKSNIFSKKSIDSVFDWFPLALKVFYDLDTNSDIELLRIAKSDIDTAVDKLMDRGNRYADSKWSSLQAVEKCIKAAIAQEGETYKWEHGLEGLAKQLAKSNIVLSNPSLLDVIQTKGGIRYGELQCTRDEALDAHHASLRVIHDLIHAGAKFRTELRIQKLGTGTYEVHKSVQPRRTKS